MISLRLRSIQLFVLVSLISIAFLADILILHSSTANYSHLSSFFGRWVFQNSTRKWFEASRNSIDDDDESSRLLVAFDPLSLCDGRRLGNQLFTVAALLFVAKLTGRTAVLPSRDALNCLDAFEEYFLTDVEGRSTSTSAAGIAIHHSSRFNVSSVQLCPCFRFNETEAMAYDDMIERLPVDHELASKRTLLLVGYFQSWRYAQPIAESIRRAFTFKPEVHRSAGSYLAEATPDFMTTSGTVDVGLVRVGVHARRGDMVNAKTGYEPPSGEFYRRALMYFIERHRRVQFIVCSDDIDWATKNIAVPSVNVNQSSDGTPQMVSVKYCPPGKSAGHDLAVLSMCDHTIVSAGTFGWWAAWLSNGTTVYFNDWPRKGTKLESMFRRADYYSPHWIPMGE